MLLISSGKENSDFSSRVAIPKPLHLSENHKASGTIAPVLECVKLGTCDLAY